MEKFLSLLKLKFLTFLLFFPLSFLDFQKSSKTVDSRVHYVVVHGNLSQVTKMHSIFLDLAQHATAAALLVLSCPTPSLLSQKLIHVRNALLIFLEPMC